jgi:hypothetical protein
LAFEEKEPMVTLTTLLDHQAVVVLGETHGHLESTRLTAALVSAYIASGRCLTVALEIASSEQPTLTAVLHGETPIGTVAVHPTVDHEGYRVMLAKPGTLIRAGKCLDVRAIDAPIRAPLSRDEWMVREIEVLAARGPVLALVGNLHALKRITWESGADDPFLAERLLRRELQVLSVIQHWEAGCKHADGRHLLATTHPRAVAGLEATMRVAAVRPPRNPAEVVDRVVIWECPPPAPASQARTDARIATRSKPLATESTE